MKGRRGYTLIESLVAFTMFATIVGSMTLVLHCLTRGERDLRAAGATARNMQRVSQQLRLDAHTAVSATRGEPSNDDDYGPDLLLDLGRNSLARYQFTRHGIERTATRPESRPHRETFFLPLSLGTDWQLVEDTNRSFVSLHLRFRGASSRRIRVANNDRDILAALRLINASGNTTGDQGD